MNTLKYTTLYLEQQRANVPRYMHFFPAGVSFLIDVSYEPDCDRVQPVPNWKGSNWPSEAETGPGSGKLLGQSMEIFTYEG